jgi:hypothetical protein
MSALAIIWNFCCCPFVSQPVDLKYALRQISKNPGFAVVVVLTLALGMGANTAIFSYVKSWILRPSPFPHIERVAILLETNKRTGATTSVSPADWIDWRDKSEIFEELAAASFASFNLTGSDEPVKIPGLQVSANFFRTLGIQPIRGREFTEEEQIPGQDRVAILSFELWRDHFGSNPDILGSTISVDGAATKVVGVLPENFQYIPMGPAQLFTPLALSPQRLAGREALFFRPVEAGNRQRSRECGDDRPSGFSRACLSVDEYKPWGLSAPAD